jgi:hypothetical protein
MPDEIKDPQAETATTPPVAESQVETPVPPVEEPFDKDRAMATIDKLRGIEKQHKQDKKELERLQAEEKKRADAQLSETEREKKRADELAAENAKIKSDLLRRDVIAEVGLPASFASRLQGTTKEELLADAQELAKTLPQLKVAPKVPPTNPANGGSVSTEAELRQTLFGGGSAKMDRATIEKLGGGIVWGNKPLTKE